MLKIKMSPRDKLKYDKNRNVSNFNNITVFTIFLRQSKGVLTSTSDKTI